MFSDNEYEKATVYIVKEASFAPQEESKGKPVPFSVYPHTLALHEHAAVLWASYAQPAVAMELLPCNQSLCLDYLIALLKTLEFE